MSIVYEVLRQFSPVTPIKGEREDRAGMGPKITKQHFSGSNQWETRKYCDIPRSVQ